MSSHIRLPNDGEPKGGSMPHNRYVGKTGRRPGRRNAELGVAAGGLGMCRQPVEIEQRRLQARQNGKTCNCLCGARAANGVSDRCQHRNLSVSK